jgi:hypothetical protein
VGAICVRFPAAQVKGSREGFSGRDRSTGVAREIDPERACWVSLPSTARGQPGAAQPARPGARVGNGRGRSSGRTESAAGTASSRKANNAGLNPVVMRPGHPSAAGGCVAAEILRRRWTANGRPFGFGNMRETDVCVVNVHGDAICAGGRGNRGALEGQTQVGVSACRTKPSMFSMRTAAMKLPASGLSRPEDSVPFVGTPRKHRCHRPKRITQHLPPCEASSRQRIHPPRYSTPRTSMQ